MIERIYVHNYRCFENFTLDLTGQGAALIIGKNGAGKSTLRHALGVFRSICRGRHRVRELIDRRDYTLNRTDIPMRFEIDLTVANKRFHYALTFEYPDHFHEARIGEEKLSVDGTLVFSRERGQVTLPKGVTFGLDWHLAALPIINDRPGEGPISQLKSFLASTILVCPAPERMSGFAEEESFELAENAGNFAAWLNGVTSRFPARYADIAHYLRLVIPDFVSFGFPPQPERGKQLIVTFEHEIKGLKRSLPLPFSKLSDGEKCFFLSALIVAVNRSDSPVFCLWDEPDSHLSLPEISHFITELRRLSNQGGQFIATSHHPETIRSFSDENTIVFTRQSHLEPTVARPLTEFFYRGNLINALTRGEVIE